MKPKLKDMFSLQDKIVVITGGGGLLGGKHAEAVAEVGGTPLLWDIDKKAIEKVVNTIQSKYEVASKGYYVDITNKNSIISSFEQVMTEFKKIDILINNAANDPKVKQGEPPDKFRFENFPLANWEKDISVGLTGALFCSQIIGSLMAEKKSGVILNIASDLGVIAPDQRLYRKEGILDNEQPVKSVSYSVVKHGLIGLTKYLSTYWADRNIRVNALSPGGVYTNQSEEFVKRLTNLIPMGRMASEEEYKAAIVFLCSGASSYLTGQNIVMDGGRSVW
jgi:NAD(P)-dependent dehydrogenase (short-subunit alcohol dehydrogenase family)